MPWAINPKIIDRIKTRDRTTEHEISNLSGRTSA